MDLKTYVQHPGRRAGRPPQDHHHKLPAKILLELEDAEPGLDEFEPWHLLETIKKRVASVTCLGAMALNSLVINCSGKFHLEGKK